MWLALVENESACEARMAGVRDGEAGGVTRPAEGCVELPVTGLLSSKKKTEGDLGLEDTGRGVETVGNSKVLGAKEVEWSALRRGRLEEQDINGTNEVEEFTLQE